MSGLKRPWWCCICLFAFNIHSIIYHSVPFKTIPSVSIGIKHFRSHPWNALYRNCEFSPQIHQLGRAKHSCFYQIILHHSPYIFQASNTASRSSARSLFFTAHRSQTELQKWNAPGCTALQSNTSLWDEEREVYTKSRNFVPLHFIYPNQVTRSQTSFFFVELPVTT